MNPCHTYGGEKFISNASWEAFRGTDNVRNVEKDAFVILELAVHKLL
jgi:hypothetical protein